MRRVSGHEMPEHVVYTLLSDVHFSCLCLFPFFLILAGANRCERQMGKGVPARLWRECREIQKPP